MKKIRPQSMRECGPSFWVEKAAQDRLRRLQDQTATAIYFALLRLHNDRGGQHWFEASAAGIADVAAVSKRAVFDKLPLLKRGGLILVKSGKSKSKQRAHEMNKFAIVWACAANARPSAEGAQGECAENTQGLVQIKPTSFAGEKEHSGDSQESPRSEGAALASANAPAGATPSGSTEGKTEESIINTWE